MSNRFHWATDNLDISTGIYRFTSHLKAPHRIDVPDEDRPQPDILVQVFQQNDSDNQRWVVAPVPGAAGTYTIRSVLIEGYYLAVRESLMQEPITTEGLPIACVQTTVARTHEWRFAGDDINTCWIVNIASGLALDVRHEDLQAPKARITQKPGAGIPNQKWRADRIG